MRGHWRSRYLGESADCCSVRGLGIEPDRIEIDEPAVKLGLLLRPKRLHRQHAFAQQLESGFIAGAVVLHFFDVPASADREHEAAARELVEARHRLGGDDRIALRNEGKLGIALATSNDWYICFNPDRTDVQEVPSDIRGLDRIQYTSFSDLEDRLSVLLDQWYPRSTHRSVDDYFGSAKQQVLDLLRKQPGLRVNEIADILNMSKKMAQVVVSQLVTDGQLRMEGKTRGAKYVLIP
jgi:hypothetical protein